MTNSKYRSQLPQLQGSILLTDGGLETTLIFHDGFELPDFAAFDLLKNEKGTDALRAYYRRYAQIARDHQMGFVLESATWRASPDWGKRLGYDDQALAAANRKAVELLFELRHEFDGNHPFVISGNIGPRGDGYSPASMMKADEAAQYHSAQIQALGEAGVDMLGAVTMTHVGEALGISRAAAKYELPLALSFTVETDGRLPTGQPLGEAIEEVDSVKDARPAYYMVNCAHPDHFHEVLKTDEDWKYRIYGVRANASRLSHAELDEAEELDDGNPVEFGLDHAELMRLLPNLRVFGGCCGTDHRHVESIADNLSTRKAA